MKLLKEILNLKCTKYVHFVEWGGPLRINSIIAVYVKFKINAQIKKYFFLRTHIIIIINFTLIILHLLFKSNLFT